MSPARWRARCIVRLGMVIVSTGSSLAPRVGVSRVRLPGRVALGSIDTRRRIRTGQADCQWPAYQRSCHSRTRPRNELTGRVVPHVVGALPGAPIATAREPLHPIVWFVGLGDPEHRLDGVPPRPSTVISCKRAWRSAAGSPTRRPAGNGRWRPRPWRSRLGDGQLLLVLVPQGTGAVGGGANRLLEQVVARPQLTSTRVPHS